MAAMAEYEREMISERTQAGMDAAQREIAVNGFRISKTGAVLRPSAIRASGNRSLERELRICRHPLLPNSSKSCERNA